MCATHACESISRMATRLEDLDKSGNFTLVGNEIRKSQGNYALPVLCYHSCDGHKINIT